MKYLLLIYQPEDAPELKSDEALQSMYAEYMSLNASLRENQQFLASGRLQPVSTATTVRIRGGKPLTTDGPFAETREQLGGFYMIEAEHLDEAIAIASRIPSARFGSVEVRPLWTMPAAT